LTFFNGKVLTDVSLLKEEDTIETHLASGVISSKII
jgi:hypothetical protein